VALFRKHLTGSSDDSNSSSSKVATNVDSKILVEFCEESPILKRLLIKVAAPAAVEKTEKAEPAAATQVEVEAQSDVAVEPKEAVQKAKTE